MATGKVVAVNATTTGVEAQFLTGARRVIGMVPDTREAHGGVPLSANTSHLTPQWPLLSPVE